jgi:V8-like Glu-specific endopeptidase
MARIDAGADITPQALGDIQAAIVAGYNHATLEQLLRYNWGLKLADEFNVNTGLKNVVSQLIEYAEADGRTAELLGLAYSGKPGNPKLQAAANKYLAEPQAAIIKYGADAPPPLPGNLEALVNSQSRLFDYGEFLKRVKSLGSRLCRVELPTGGGTGWLVGATHALTNYHVAKDVIEKRLPADKMICRFDYWKNNEDDEEPKGTPVGVSAIVASSRYSESDVTGTGTPDEGELDYALMKLAKAIGNSKGRDGAKRGWFELSPEQPIITRGDVAMIPQHPEAKPLELAYGTVVDFPATNRRYRYDVTTQPGSSGSPVFTPDLGLFGLHHAAEPTNNPKFNQAVPVWRVTQDLQDKKIVWAA